MSTPFRYVPHPRVREREAQGPPTVAQAARRAHGQGRVARWNTTIGLRITVVVGTMWCAYLFALLALVSAPSAFASGNALVIVAWIAQTFLQLVLLPIIIVGQNVQAAASDQRALATYQDATMILAEVRQIQAHLSARDVELDRLRALLPAALAGPGPTPDTAPNLAPGTAPNLAPGTAPEAAPNPASGTARGTGTAGRPAEDGR